MVACFWMYAVVRWSNQNPQMRIMLRLPNQLVSIFFWCYRAASWCWKVRRKPQTFSTKWKTGYVRAWERLCQRSEKNRHWEWMNHWVSVLFFFCLFVGWGVDSCPSPVRLEEDAFEETAKERRGRSPGAQAKWNQMSERVCKVEPSCTVVVFSLIWSSVACFYFIFPGCPLFPCSLSLSHFCPLCVWMIVNYVLFQKYRMQRQMNIKAYSCC